MLKRVYWVGTKQPNVITAGVGFRAGDDAPYERSIERWEKESDRWVYKGAQSPERQKQLEAHPLISAHFE
ncbi:hypothetical protein [Paenibacillus sp.]|uniref:hypothetical protein n=1 Tax=Paenibacillus sp. TaxID=58172 RepID=UPI002D3BD48E|nr:hypothetical protein [Paenibacillus sp.]HZG88032.1 hypothetical protein [Paenibacillus sp.]